MGRKRTIGEFFDEVFKWAEQRAEQGRVLEARFFLKEWAKIVSPERWEEIRTLPFNAQFLFSFAQDMAFYYNERLIGIGTEDLFLKTLQDGHNFLRAIHTKAKEFGVEVSVNQIDVPLTYIDPIFLKRHLRVIK